MKPLDTVLKKLKNVQERNGAWQASCPAHEDRSPSLSISEGDDGRVLLHCHGSCPKRAVLDAAGLSWSDLYPSSVANGSRNARNKTGGKPTAVWQIKDADGVVQAEHVRFDRLDGGKDCFWRLPGASKWGLKGRKLPTLPLYHSEHVKDFPEDAPVVVVEGEKAADALAEVYPAVVATVTGAEKTPGRDALEVLRGRTVLLWCDNDAPGRAHMEHVATALQGLATETRVFEWTDAPEKGDAADHPAVKSRSRKAVEDLVKEMAAAPVWRARGEERNGKATDAERVGRLLSAVVPERVRWLWEGRIPLGKLTILDGDPGNGKSALTTDLAARISVGRSLPDGTPCEEGPGGVVLLNAEDGLADTIRPRLEAAGADLDRALALATTPDGEGFERLLSIPEDLHIIRKGIDQVKARLVVLDPLMAFVSGNVNSHKDQDIRRALAPLAKLAEETGAAVVVVRHLNQATGQNALYRGGGSIGIVGQARSALLVAKDPQDEDRRVLAPLKNNLAKPAPSLAFVLTEAANGAVRVEWKGETNHNADALLAAPVDAEERSAVDEAAEFLRDALGRGPVWSKQVKKEAREADIAEKTLFRAKKALGVRSVKEGDGSWSWSLPNEAARSDDEEGQGVQEPYPSHDDHLDHLPIDKPNQEHQGEKQHGQGDHLEERSELLIDKPNSHSKDRQDGQDGHVDSRNDCIHGYPGGKGCYLCDPEHPSREKSGVR